MKINKSHSEIVTHRRIQIELYQDNYGHWGWIIGNHILLPSFSSRESALYTARRHIDERN